MKFIITLVQEQLTFAEFPSSERVVKSFSSASYNRQFFKIPNFITEIIIAQYCSCLILNLLTLCCWANILSRTIDPGSERKLPRAENFVFNSSAVFSNRLSNAGHMYNYVPVEESSSCITHPSSSSIFFLMAAFEHGSCFQFWFFNIYLQLLLLCVSPLWRSHWSPWLSQQTNNFSKYPSRYSFLFLGQRWLFMAVVDMRS